MKMLLRFSKDEEGVAGAEDGLMAALIAGLISIVIIVVVATIVVKRLEKKWGYAQLAARPEDLVASPTIILAGTGRQEK